MVLPHSHIFIAFTIETGQNVPNPKSKSETFKEFTRRKGSSYTKDKATFSLAVISIHFCGKETMNPRKRM